MSNSMRRQQLWVWVLIFLLGPMMGCSMASKKPSIKWSSRLDKLTHKLSERDQRIEELRTENLVLKQKLAEDLKPATNEVVPVLPSFSSEKEHYSFIITTYRLRKLKTLRQATKEFLEKYPISIYSDNALYLLGSLELSRDLYGEGIKTLEQLLRSYPNSNKRVSALLAKGLTYKKLNLKGPAEDVFREVLSSFPGSPESFRARSELKLLGKKSSPVTSS